MSRSQTAHNILDADISDVTSQTKHRGEQQVLRPADFVITTAPFVATIHH